MTKNKYFVFSDLHGEADGFEKALEEAGYDRYDKTHYLVSCGDNFDRGRYSAEILEILRGPRVICVKGNHDCFLEEYLEKGIDGEYVLFNILRNGLNTTISSLCGKELGPSININTYQDVRREIQQRYGFLLSWLKNMPKFFETKHFIFCHAGVDPRVRHWKETKDDFFLWDIDYSHIVPNNTDGKIVVFGHHHVSQVRQICEDSKVRYTDLRRGSLPQIKGVYGNKDDNAPIYMFGKIAIDGCTYLTKTPNIIVIEDEPMDEPEAEKEEVQEPTISDVKVSIDSELHTFSYGGNDYTYTINTDGFRTNNIWNL